MISLFPACFLKEKDGYTVLFPDWDNTVTCGTSFNEAMKMAIDCLAGLIFENEISGIPLPEATAITDVDTCAAAEFLECAIDDITIQMISVDADEYAKKHFTNCIKKTVTIYEWQNIAGIKQGINFSKVFQEALTAKLLKAK